MYFRMGKLEPVQLTEIGALTGHLEVEETFREVLFRLARVVKLAVFVVLVDEVFDDGARLHKSA